MAWKNRKDFPKTVHISKTKLPKNLKQPDSYEVDFLLYGYISLNFDFCVKTRFLDENGHFFHISADLN
jgi:hypothetical protein